MESNEELKQQESETIEDIEDQLAELFMDSIKEANLTMVEYNDMVRTLVDSENLTDYLNRARIAISRIEPGTRGEKIYNLAKKYFELRKTNN